MSYADQDVISLPKSASGYKHETVAVDRTGTRPTNSWPTYQKILFRFFFIYFILQIVPLDGGFYQHLFSLDLLHLQLSDLFYLSRYSPHFITGSNGFAEWGIIAVIATAGATVWSYRDKHASEYNTLYYYLRVALRYRLAIALTAFALVKIFPMQMPWPSLSNLNTHYGDIARWKLFSMSTGIVPGYESFLGYVELAIALLLVNRKTASIGAFLILPFTGNVFMSNIAYDGGEYVYSLYLILIALFLVAFDAERIIRLTSFEKPTLPVNLTPDFSPAWRRNSRWALKTLFVLFVLIYGFKSFEAYRDGGYQYPAQKAIPGVEGIYKVAEFRYKNEILPVSLTDPNRWTDVVFEKWATVSIRNNKVLTPHLANSEEIFNSDEQRNYEQTGNAGRQFYKYTFDDKTRLLTLRDPDHSASVLTLHYDQPATRTIILSGVDEHADSLNITLQRIDKKYLLEEAAARGRNAKFKL
jgi:hypothetical protein